jgi:hypothetical protein
MHAIVGDWKPTVRALAALVRHEAENWARSKGYCHVSLLSQCSVVSVAFVETARAVGLEAELLEGVFTGTNPPDGHFWAFAWEDKQCLLVDLTVTQYIEDAPRAAVFTYQDLPALYFLRTTGDDARARMHPGDIVEAQELLARLARVVPALRT